MSVLNVVSLLVASGLLAFAGFLASGRPKDGGGDDV